MVQPVLAQSKKTPRGKIILGRLRLGAGLNKLAQQLDGGAAVCLGLRWRALSTPRCAVKGGLLGAKSSAAFARFFPSRRMDQAWPRVVPEVRLGWVDLGGRLSDAQRVWPAGRRYAVCGCL